MRKRSQLLALLIVLSLVIAYWASRSSPARPHAVAPPGSIAEEAPVLAVPALDAAVEPSTRSVEAANPQPAVSTAVTYPRELSGPLVLTDARGAVVQATRGSLRLLQTTGAPTPVDCSARVAESRWILQVERAGSFTPTTLAIGTSAHPRQSQRATCVPTSFPADVAEGPTIRAVLEDGPVLRVLDRATDRDLDQLLLVVGEAREFSPMEDGQMPPSEYPVLGEDASISSPYRFPATFGTCIAWVRAPGYAWRRIAIARTDVTVRLSPGADLRAEVVGEIESGVRKVVRVYAPKESNRPELVLAERPIPGSRIVAFEGLPEGDVDVRLEHVGRVLLGDVLAHAPATLSARATSHVTLDPARSPSETGLGRLDVRIRHGTQPSPIARSSGLSLVVESARTPPEMRADTLSAANTEQADGRVEWNGPQLLPGEYVVSLPSYGLATKVVVQPGTTSVAEFELTEPSEVEITVVRADGTVTNGAELLVRPALSKAVFAWREIQPGRASAPYRFRCQKGPIDVCYPRGGANDRIERFHVVDSKQGFTITLAPGQKASRLLVTASNGTGPVTMPLAFWEAITIDPIGESGRLVGVQYLGDHVGGSSALDAAQAGFDVDAPGRYRVAVPRWIGFAPTDPQEVTVAREGSSLLLLLRMD